MIRTRQQGDAPFFPNMLNNWMVEVCLKEDVDKVIREKDAEIEDLLRQNRELCQALQVMYSKEEYGKLQKEIESLKASHYAEMVDAGMRERRLRSALWLARGYIMTLLQRDFQRLAYQCNNDDYKKNLLRRRNRFYDLHEKCLKKAGFYL